MLDLDNLKPTASGVASDPWTATRAAMSDSETAESLVRQLETRHIHLADSRDDWLRIAFALAELGEVGREFFHRVSRLSDKYDWKSNERQYNDALRSRGRSARPVTFASFVQRCKEVGVYPDRPVCQPFQPVHHTGVRTMTPQPCFLMEYLTGLFGPERARELQRLYRIDTRTDGAVVYWTIDEEGRYRDGKVMYYLPDGHRDKSPRRMPRTIRYGTSDEASAAALPPGPCLFGQHLLPLYPSRPVAVVEAEKTALIASARLASQGFLWLAAGGLSHLRVEHFEALRGRTVVVYPDTDPEGDTYRRWQAICQRAVQRYQLTLLCSDLLERCASPEEKERKVDVADLLVP